MNGGDGIHENPTAGLQSAIARRARRGHNGAPRSSALNRTTVSDSPDDLQRLVTATPPDQDRAWTRFLEAYSRLVLHVARSVCHDRDEAMDAYAHVLEELRANDFARLRAYTADGRTKFSTWLVVVIRRLCLDHARQAHGRKRDDPHTERARLERAARVQIEKLEGDDAALSLIPGEHTMPEDALSAAEIREALAVALDALPPADRLLLALRFEDDLSAQRIAQVLKLPSPFHVYRRLDAITRQLRQHLVARGFEDAAS